MHRQPRLEILEPRIALAATGLVDVGAQPSGALTGKVVYVHAGHGYVTVNSDSSPSWDFQRGLGFGIVEDLGNQDQMTLFADELWRAGATVAALRPIGHQINEVVLDNDDPEVSFSGDWTDSSASVYFGEPGDVPYRFAAGSTAESAVATYRPNLPEAGFYPVYAWTRSGSDRAEQLYRVNHAGGSTEVTVNHRRVGNGTVYLGTFFFDSGTAGSVEISNRSSEAGRVVIADMIRFGNGMGDINAGDGVSGQAREDEAGLYWVEWHVDHAQGIATSEYRTASDDRDAAVTFAPRYAEYMNRETDGTQSDRVFVSFHSNAGGGNARGVLGLFNGNNTPSSATPNQLLLARSLAQEVNNDLVAQNGQFEHDWFNRGTSVTLDRSDIEFGEINNAYAQNEFDATIVEVAFHDNQLDTDLLRAPLVRQALAKATTQGLVKYFKALDSQTPLIMSPGPVADVRAQAVGVDGATLSWGAPAVNSAVGDAPTGYRVYGSTNGYALDGGTYVPGGATTNVTLTGLDRTLGPYYFRVAAVNEGGESPSSEAVAVRPGDADAKLLIVNGFDRLDRTQNPRQAVPGSGLADRVRPRESNSLDYAIQVAGAVAAASPTLQIETSANELVAAGAVDLTAFDAVIWILGEESSANATFDANEQMAVQHYLESGGKLFVSGSEIGYELDSLNQGRIFYNAILRADYVSDDADAYAGSGAPGSIYDGLALRFGGDDAPYDVNSPDVLIPQAGARSALVYATGGTAAIQYADDVSGARLVMWAFPFEAVVDADVRQVAMAQTLEYFGFPIVREPMEWIFDNDQGAPTYQETGGWSTATQPGYDLSTYRFVPTGSAASATWRYAAPYAGRAEIFVHYQAAGNRATDTVYQIDTGLAIEAISVDQRQNGDQWVWLGALDVLAGARSVTLDAATSSGGSVVIADAVRVTISPLVDPSGDFDASGNIDGIDFLAWQKGFGTQILATPSAGDSDQDADVDDDDLAVWAGQFGIELASLTPIATATAAARAPATRPPLAAPLPDASDLWPALITQLASSYSTAKPAVAQWGPRRGASESSEGHRLAAARDVVFSEIAPHPWRTPQFSGRRVAPTAGMRPKADHGYVDAVRPASSSLGTAI